MTGFNEVLQERTGLIFTGGLVKFYKKNKKNRINIHARA